MKEAEVRHYLISLCFPGNCLGLTVLLGFKLFSSEIQPKFAVAEEKMKHKQFQIQAKPSVVSLI